MAKITSFTLGGGIVTMFKSLFNVRIHKDLMVLSKKRYYYTKYNKDQIKDESRMDLAAQEYNDLTDSEKLAWEVSATYTPMTGYQLFMQDTMYRKAKGYPYLSTPKLEQQFKYGWVDIDAGSGEFLFRQNGGYAPVDSINRYGFFYCVLTADGGAPNYVKYTFRYWRNVGGVRTPVEITTSLNLTAGWQHITDNTAILSNAYDGWELDIYGKGVKGWFCFDNVYCTDGKMVSSKDTMCNVVNRYWLKLKYPSGVTMTEMYDI